MQNEGPEASLPWENRIVFLFIISVMIYFIIPSIFSLSLFPPCFIFVSDIFVNETELKVHWKILLIHCLKIVLICFRMWLLLSPEALIYLVLFIICEELLNVSHVSCMAQQQQRTAGHHIKGHSLAVTW